MWRDQAPEPGVPGGVFDLKFSGHRRDCSRRLGCVGVRSYRHGQDTNDEATER